MAIDLDDLKTNRQAGHTVTVEVGSNHVRVEVDGTVLADTVHPLLLHETGLPLRYYIPAADVRAELLRPSDTHTVCPYKGVASYHTAVVGDREIRDIAWYYPEPFEECAAIRDAVCFYDNKAHTVVE